MLLPTFLALHLLAAVVWVGGMFFAYLALRPAVGEVLEPPQPLRLMAATFRRFLRWVWACVIILLVTGYGLIGLYGGMANVGTHIHVMNAVGLLMMALFAHLFFAPYRRLSKAVAEEAWEVAAKNLNQVRVIVLVNLVLGLGVVAVAGAGRFL